MNFNPNNVYHVYNQGNNRQETFSSREDYLIFLSLFKKLFIPHCSSLIAWCLMPNHFHFMIHTDEKCNLKIKQGGLLLDPISNAIRKLLSGYTRIYNQRYNKTGSLFRQRTKYKCVSEFDFVPGSVRPPEIYLENCFNYIHQNPLVSNLVQRLENWEFSSYNEYAGLTNEALCNKEFSRKFCGFNEDEFIEKSHKIVDKDIIRLFY